MFNFTHFLAEESKNECSSNQGSKKFNDFQSSGHFESSGTGFLKPSGN